MFGRQKRNEINPCEEQYKAYLDALYMARNALESAIHEVLVREKVISLYPDCPDKEQAKRELAKAQQDFRCAIGAYDARRAEAINYYKENSEQLITWATPMRFCASHDYIATVVRNATISH